MGREQALCNASGLIYFCEGLRTIPLFHVCVRGVQLHTISAINAQADTAGNAHTKRADTRRTPDTEQKHVRYLVDTWPALLPGQ